MKTKTPRIGWKENTLPAETIIMPGCETAVAKLRARLQCIGEVMETLECTLSEYRNETVEVCKRLYVYTENPVYLKVGNAASVDANGTSPCPDCGGHYDDNYVWVHSGGGPDVPKEPQPTEEASSELDEDRYTAAGKSDLAGFSIERNIYALLYRVLDIVRRSEDENYGKACAMAQAGNLKHIFAIPHTQSHLHDIIATRMDEGSISDKEAAHLLRILTHIVRISSPNAEVRVTR